MGKPAINYNGEWFTFDNDEAGKRARTRVESAFETGKAGTVIRATRSRGGLMALVVSAGVPVFFQDCD